MKALESLGQKKQSMSCTIAKNILKYSEGKASIVINAVADFKMMAMALESLPPVREIEFVFRSHRDDVWAAAGDFIKGQLANYEPLRVLRLDVELGKTVVSSYTSYWKRDFLERYLGVNNYTQKIAPPSLISDLCLTSLSQIKTLQIKGYLRSIDWAPVAAMPHLQRLELAKTSIARESMQTLCKALLAVDNPELLKLREVILDDNPLLFSEKEGVKGDSYERAATFTQRRNELFEWIITLNKKHGMLFSLKNCLRERYTPDPAQNPTWKYIEELRLRIEKLQDKDQLSAEYKTFQELSKLYQLDEMNVKAFPDLAINDSFQKRQANTKSALEETAKGMEQMAQAIHQRGSFDANYILGEYYQNAGNCDKAYVFYSEIPSSHPTFVEARYRIFMMLGEGGIQPSLVDEVKKLSSVSTEGADKGFKLLMAKLHQVQLVTTHKHPAAAEMRRVMNIEWNEYVHQKGMLQPLVPVDLYFGMDTLGHLFLHLKALHTQILAQQNRITEQASKLETQSTALRERWFGGHVDVTREGRHAMLSQKAAELRFSGFKPTLSVGGAIDARGSKSLKGNKRALHLSC